MEREIKRRRKRRLKHRIDWPCTPIVRRKHAKPLAKNPIRRFREELRMNRTEFSKLTGWPVETLRQYEREGPTVCQPGGKRMSELIQLARESRYPLSVVEIIAYVITEQNRGPIPAGFYEGAEEDDTEG